MADINNILRDITNAYVEKGYVTSRAFVKQEAIKRVSVLEIYAMEGTIGANYYQWGRSGVSGAEDDGFSHAGRPSLPCARDERGLDQLNTASDAVMDDRPG